MDTAQPASRMIPGIGAAIILVQIFDIIVHVATDQPEPIRIASNVIVMAWVLLTLSERIPSPQQLIGFGVIGVYLLMNIIFLFIEGFTNDGDPRILFFILVALTTILSGVLTYRTSPSS